MAFGLASALFITLVVPPQQSMLTGLTAALDANDSSSVRSFFAQSADSKYLIDMADDAGGLKNIRVSILPTPSGWPKDAGHWVVFHTRQAIEAHHDPVYSTVITENGLRIGKEIPESTPQAARIASLRAIVDLDVPSRSATVSSLVALQRWAEPKALVFRLADHYSVSEILADGSALALSIATATTIPAAQVAGATRAGSLLVVTGAKLPNRVEVRYSGVLDFPSGDHISDKAAYLTAWWTPSIARLPHRSSVQITGPPGWVLRSEGEEIVNRTEAGRQMSDYRCELPISYPKVVAGQYRLAAEKSVGRNVFRAYHFEPIEQQRAEADVEKMANAFEFLEQKLGKFPFPGYECFDAESYYGIESYSYTLLAKNISTRYVAHEMTHTYFGGLAPSAYIQDSWNEGATVYVDDILTGNLVDRPLEQGLRSVQMAYPLDRMAAAHSHGGNSYWRGAYVFKMLEHEIGERNVLGALKEIVRDRVGKDTTWKDLRPYFERAGRKDLSKFWSQWVHGSIFPTVSIVSAVPGAQGVELVVRQTGTPQPYALRFRIKLTRGTQQFEGVVAMSSTQQIFRLKAPFIPEFAEIDPLGYALVQVGPKFTL